LLRVELADRLFRIRLDDHPSHLRVEHMPRIQIDVAGRNGIAVGCFLLGIGKILGAQQAVEFCPVDDQLLEHVGGTLAAEFQGFIAFSVA